MKDSNSRDSSAATGVVTAVNTDIRQRRIDNVYEELPEKLRNTPNTWEHVRGDLSSRSFGALGKSKQRDHSLKAGKTNITLPLPMKLVHNRLLGERKRVKYDMEDVSEFADYLLTREKEAFIQNKGDAADSRM